MLIQYVDSVALLVRLPLAAAELRGCGCLHEGQATDFFKGWTIDCSFNISCAITGSVQNAAAGAAMHQARLNETFHYCSLVCEAKTFTRYGVYINISFNLNH